MTRPKNGGIRAATSRCKPKAFDIFCGCGGTTQGLRDAGFNVVGGIECDDLAVATYRANHKRARVWDQDIRGLEPADVLTELGIERGELALMSGCPPCQAFSALPRLNGSRRIRDKDSKDLVFEYLRFVHGLFPKVVLVENVPRLLDDYRFADVRKQLRALGYLGEPQIFNAADFGVPQRRRRMIFIASRIGTVEYASPSTRGCRTTVRHAIGDLLKPGRTGDELHDYPEIRSKKVARLIAAIPKNGGSRLELGNSRQLECHRNCDGFKDVYGRTRSHEPVGMIIGGVSIGFFRSPSPCLLSLQQSHAGRWPNG